MDKETRVAVTAELRVSNGDQPKITGYAAVFNSLSDDLGGFREQIKRGAFKRTLDAGADVRALVDHDPSRILGRTTAGTLTVREDRNGLLVEIDPPDTTAGRDILESIRRGDVSQMSFAFSVPPGGEKWVDDGKTATRTLTDVDLYDVSAVSFPAYPDTSVAVRSLGQFKEAERDRDAACRLRLAR